MDLHRIPQWICIGPWSRIHFSYHAGWLLLVQPKFNFLSWSDAHESFGIEWIVQFIVRSICRQFCMCWCACIIRIWFWIFLIDSLTFLLPLYLLKGRSVKMLNTIVCSGPSVWLYSIPKNAWLHLSFRGHWPYQLKSNNGSCSRTNAWQLSTYPRRRVPAFVPYGSSVLTHTEHYVCYSCEKQGSPSFFLSKRAVHAHSHDQK
jgi:hypothetical protein